MAVAALRTGASKGHLRRYRQLAQLLVKYGRSDIVRKASIDEIEGGDGPGSVKPGDPSPEDLARDLEALGPTFVKLGQLLSTRPDILPMRYIEALTRLQDK